MSNDWNTIYGGSKVPITFRDGTTAEVKLRALKLSEVYDYLGKAVDLPQEALLMCMEDPTELDFDALTIESYNLLLEKNYELNFTMALQVTQADLERAKRMRIGLTTALKTAMHLLRKFSPQSLSAEAIPANRF